jgi:hypothetical protein
MATSNRLGLQTLPCRWHPYGAGTTESYLPLFNAGLAETGYVVGLNVTIESRESDVDRLPALAADLVRRHVTMIAAVGLERCRSP